MNAEQKNARRRELYAMKKAKENAEKLMAEEKRKEDAKKYLEASSKQYRAMVEAGMPTERRVMGFTSEEILENAKQWVAWDAIKDEWMKANPLSKFYD